VARSPLKEAFMHEFPQQNGRFNLSGIDLRRLTPEQWVGLKTQIELRARSDRNRAIGVAVGTALSWVWRTFRSLLKRPRLRAAWISQVRKSRERIAAAELRGLSDQWLADMGLTRGQIENCVRYRPRPSSRTR
jgi:uncharacterized protein YjiS (DUF1127 family)